MGDGPCSNYGPNAHCQFVLQICRLIPNYVIILARIEMNIVKDIASASEYNGNTESVSKSCLVIDATTRSVITMREVGNYEASPTNFGDDLVINFVYVLRLVNPHRLEPRPDNGRSKP